MLSIYAITIFLCIASVLVGEEVLRLSSVPRASHLAPATGVATLIIVASAVFWIPGQPVTGGVILAVVTVAAGALRLRRESVSADHLVGLATAVLMLGLVSVPFIVNRHTGIFGVSLDDDFAAHFTWATSLVTSLPGADIVPGYPLGPHVLAVSLGGLFGTNVAPPFTALLLSTPVLTALTARSVWSDAERIPQVCGALLVGLPYLVAVHMGEGAFKELMLGLMVLGIALALRKIEIEGDWTLRRGVAPGLMVAAALLIYGRTGIAWPALAVALWAFFALLARRVRPSWALARRAAGPFGIALLCAFLGSLAELGRLLTFSGGVSGGNVPSYTSPFEVLGVWFSGDFRFVPASALPTDLLQTLGIALAIYALTWWWRHRDIAVPATAVGALIIYVVVRETQGPYLASKPPIIAAPIVILTIVGPLVYAWRWSGISVARALTAAAGVAFLTAGLWSTLFALRYAYVGSDETAEELAPIRDIVRGKSTLDLVADYFAFWDLRGARLSSPTAYSAVSVVPFNLRPTVPTQGFLGVNSIASASLDSFRYIVTTRSLYASALPSNWKLAAVTPQFALWRRRGQTMPFEVPTLTAPGEVFNCTTARGRELKRSSGIAWAWNVAPIGPAISWRAGTVVLPSAGGVVGVATGNTVNQILNLPPGTWELSLPYQAHADLYVEAGNLRATMPSELDNFGPYWRIGDVTSDGRPIRVTIRLQTMGLGAALEYDALGGLVAVSVPHEVGIIPLAQACGRYIDAYIQ